MHSSKGLTLSERLPYRSPYCNCALVCSCWQERQSMDLLLIPRCRPFWITVHIVFFFLINYAFSLHLTLRVLKCNVFLKARKSTSPELVVGEFFFKMNDSSPIPMSNKTNNVPWCLWSKESSKSQLCLKELMKIMCIHLAKELASFIGFDSLAKNGHQLNASFSTEKLRVVINKISKKANITLLQFDVLPSYTLSYIGQWFLSSQFLLCSGSW